MENFDLKSYSVCKQAKEKLEELKDFPIIKIEYNDPLVKSNKRLFDFLVKHFILKQNKKNLKWKDIKKDDSFNFRYDLQLLAYVWIILRIFKSLLESQYI